MFFLCGRCRCLFPSTVAYLSGSSLLWSGRFSAIPASASIFVHAANMRDSDPAVKDSFLFSFFFLYSFHASVRGFLYVVYVV